MKACLDASVIVAVVAGEPTAGMVGEWLATAVDEVLISDFARGEFVAALRSKERQGVISPRERGAFLVAGEAWFASASFCRIDNSDIALATTYLVDTDQALRLPDAIHIAVAARFGATLVTLDRQQLHAALAAGVAAVDPLRTTSSPELP